MKLRCYSPDGLESSEKDFAIAEVEGDKWVEALRQVLVAYRAAERQGTTSTKTRAEVRGTGRKPYRQKGTGSARHGSRRSNIWRGGGVVFGPKPRNYRQKVNNKVKIAALHRAIYDRASSGEIDVIEELETAEPKTRLLNALVGRIAPGGSVLLIDESFSDNTLRAARNIARIATSDANSVNALDISLPDRVLISERGMENILKRVNGGAANEESI